MVVRHWYRFADRGETHVGLYMGRQKGFECMVCGCGHNAHTFNIYHSDEWNDYETWSYGTEHLPTVIEDLGESGKVFPDMEG